MLDTDAALGGGVDTQYGAGTQCNDRHPVNDLLLHCNDQNKTVEVYKDWQPY